ncbi:hypothetical protein LCGC14_1689520, partial [marine sediment metagenome]
SMLYDKMNLEWKELLMRRDLPGQPKLDENKQMQFFMASYDMDRFRQYVFGSGLLDKFEIARDEIEAMKSDETALMQFGFRYLKFLLGLEETLQLKK